MGTGYRALATANMERGKVCAGSSEEVGHTPGGKSHTLGEEKISQS